MSFFICALYLTTLLTSQTIHFTTNKSNITYTLSTITTLQVVVNPLLSRQSPIYTTTYQHLSKLNASFVRFVPWFPYPKYGVAQLNPSSNKYLCTHLNGDSNNNNWTISLQCPSNSIINKIYFASWGNPIGNCGNFELGNCNANNSLLIANEYCLNKNYCEIPVNIDTFNGDPCYGVVKSFAIQVTCDIEGYMYSNWNFSMLDPFMEDLMNNVNPNKTMNKTVINFSTIPNWFYKGVNYGAGYTDNPDDCSWGYNIGTQLIENDTPSKIGEYYGNLINWYTNKGFIDEYGNKYISNHTMIIDTWEVLNEVESEHQNTPQSYTILYDNIVTQIQKIADPQKKIKFMGLALAYHYEWNWYEYFLNISNHMNNDIPIDYISFHFYANAKSRTNPDDYQAFFTQADTFFIEVENITKIRDRLSPNTMIDIDEMGVILPGDNNVGAAIPPAIYWNAAGAMYAYCFGKLSKLGIDILGESQFMGYPFIPESEFPSSPGGLPPQFPSVTEIDWNTGIGNARYWILKLLIDHFNIGMQAFDTEFTNDDIFFAQGFIDNNNGNTKILMVNKVNKILDIESDQLTGATLFYIDQNTGNNEANITEINGNTLQLQPYTVAILYPLV